MELRIDPEFQNKIPPLTEAEFEQLKENILADGEVYEPIIAWNGTIVDGHNRWKIIQENPNLPYKVRVMNFSDKWEAFDWMYKKQLGRRNLTDEQKSYLRGKLYEARKHSVTNAAGKNQYSKEVSAQSEHQPNRVSEQIAKEQGVGKETIKRDEKFAKGIDAIREESPETADSILKGELSVTKADVMEIAKEHDKPTLREKIEKLRSGEPIREKKEEPKARIVQSEPIMTVHNPDEKSREFTPGTRENRELNKRIRDGIARMTDTTLERAYTLDMMLTEMRSAFDMYVRGIESYPEMHPELFTKKNKKAIEDTFKEYLTDKIAKMKEEIQYV